MLLKQGEFQDAIKDYETIVKIDQSNTEAVSKLDKIYSILSDLGTAKNHMANRDYQPAINIFTNILEVIFLSFILPILVVY